MSATAHVAIASTEETPERAAARARGLANLRPFKKGQPSANPHGRPPGSRQRITEAFLAALAKDFAANKAQVFKDVRAKDPSTYLRVVAGLLPAQAELALHNSGGPGERSLEHVQREIAAAIEKRAQQIADERLTVATVDKSVDILPVDVAPK